jgi:hypothetical protein
MWRSERDKVKKERRKGKGRGVKIRKDVVFIERLKLRMS